MPDLLSQLRPIFQDVMDNPGLIITPQSNARTVEGWDSLAHINLITAIECEFKIRFALGELEELKNVGDMIALMEQKLGSS